MILLLNRNVLDVLQEIIPESAVQSAAPGVSPDRGLLILRRESHPPCRFGLNVRLLADVIQFSG